MISAPIRNCRECGNPYQRDFNAQFCFACVTLRNARAKERAKARRLAKKNGEPVVYMCVDCGAPREYRWCRQCDKCSNAMIRRGWKWGIEAGKPQAHAAVAAAKKAGLLPALDGSIQCADCGKPAAQYDHRDYNYPLFVVPVCRSCNLRRGPAIPLKTLGSSDTGRAA